jgi:hypothetical protein
MFFFSFVIYAVMTFSGDSSSSTDSSVSSPSCNIVVTPLNTEPDEDNAYYYCGIAGVNYHCTHDMLGCRPGIVFNQRWNEHDKRAMAVVDGDGVLYGYIPSSELRRYRAWCKNAPYPCMIYISTFKDAVSGRTMFLGRVGVVRPYSIEYANEKMDVIGCVLKDDRAFHDVAF